MEKFPEAFVYKLVSSHCTKIYIGSTSVALNLRFNYHKSNYKQWLQDRHGNNTAFKIMKYSDARIVPLAKFKNITKDDLCKKEQEWKKKFVDLTVNQRNSYDHRHNGFQNSQSYRRYHKKWEASHKKTCIYCGNDHFRISQHLRTEIHKKNKKAMKRILSEK